MKYLYSVVILLLVAIFLTFSINAVYGYFYPMKYKSEIENIASKYEVEPALIASVINVESSFKGERVSNKGAVGLMQLMPSTAEWVCGRLKIEYDKERLFETEYNINIGSYYLYYLLNSFQDVKTALCAYNAGPTNVKNWLSERQYSDDGKSLKEIPFKETKNYVNKIDKNLNFYKRKYR